MRIGELGVGRTFPSGVSESMGLVNVDKALTHLRFWKLTEMVLEFQDLAVRTHSGRVSYMGFVREFGSSGVTCAGSGRQFWLTGSFWANGQILDQGAKCFTS